MESYAAAVTGAQKAAKNSLEDINEHLTDLRYQSILGASSQSPQAGGSDVWFRVYGGNSRYGDNSADFNSNFYGMHGGWDKLIKGGKAGENERMHFGALLGYGKFDQNDVVSSVKNTIKNSYAEFTPTIRRTRQPAVVVRECHCHTGPDGIQQPGAG